MKYALLFSMMFFLSNCGERGKDVQKLQTEIDRLKKQVDMAYRPGFGEFMSGIQVHHAKLWFAGEAQNWPLADFEMHEIEEALDGIKAYNSDRQETPTLTMIDPAMDSVSAAIRQKDPQRFNSSFLLLTNTCNNCHRVTKHEFNVIKIPDTPPFSNQEFKVQ